MRRPACLLLALALLGTAARAVEAQDSGAIAALRVREANLDGPFARRMASSDSLVARAREQVGKRYKYASASPDHGFDCSGLAKYVLGAFGVDLPHNAARIAREGEPVKADATSMRPGDLLIFGRGRSSRISHVGIYVGDGRMIHASTAQRRVIETALPSPGSSLKLRTVRRVLQDSSAAHRGSE